MNTVCRICPTIFDKDLGRICPECKARRRAESMRYFQQKNNHDDSEGQIYKTIMAIRKTATITELAYKQMTSKSTIARYVKILLQNGWIKSTQKGEYYI